MNQDTASLTLARARPPAVAAMPRSARFVLGLLRHLKAGRLELWLPDGSTWQAGPGTGPHASVRVHDWAVFGDALRAGDIGFAEAFIDGRWSTPDLVSLLSLLNLNRAALEPVVYGSWWGGLAHRLRHLLNRNSRRGSKRNIHAHYDLGNAFYAEWLDESMNYSSAWFDGRPGQSLVDAQRAKMRRAIEQLALQPGQRVLEIGCGWGAVAETAARDHGLSLTGVTLSTEQLAWGRQRLARQGLDQRAELRLQDYRDVADGPYDGIVSIEMFEAVGEPYWATWFGTVARLLKPGAKACVQTITIRDDLFERYRSGTDFIQQYVFPGGMLPSRGAFRAQAERAGLQLVDEFAFGPDYAETLRRWRQAFLAREAAVRGQGFDDRFMRIWEFYLAYCEAAFATGSTDVVQFTLRRV